MGIGGQTQEWVKPSYLAVCTVEMPHRMSPPMHMQDMFTSLTGASKPHHIVDDAGVVLD